MVGIVFFSLSVLLVADDSEYRIAVNNVGSDDTVNKKIVMTVNYRDHCDRHVILSDMSWYSQDTRHHTLVVAFDKEGSEEVHPVYAQIVAIHGHDQLLLT